MDVGVEAEAVVEVGVELEVGGGGGGGGGIGMKRGVVAMPMVSRDAWCMAPCSECTAVDAQQLMHSMTWHGMAW